MKHCILVKFADGVSDKAELIRRISSLYERWTEYPFLKGCRLLTSCVDRSNRYDLAIVLTMEKEDLPLWDGCALHKSWKSDFGSYVASKAIFDFNE